MQKYFRDQIAALRASKDPYKSPADRTEANLQYNRCLRNRFHVANSLQLEQLPILKLFEDILRQPRASDRVHGYMLLDRLLGECCSSKLAALLNRREQARQRYEDRASQKISSEELQQLQRARMQAELAFAESVVAPEHLFREMAYMYDAMRLQAQIVLAQDGSPGHRVHRDEAVNRYVEMPMMVALHLLDGFPIELIDGDCSYANRNWLKAVISSLEAAIHLRYPSLNGRSIRVFVISILGVQKAGKSSLLNVMFGSRFRTSIERCTRGLNMQLLHCERDDGLFDLS